MHFKKYSIYDISIVPLITVKGLAEPCRKSNRLTLGIKMPRVTECIHSEICYPLSPLLGGENCHRCRGYAEAVPQYHRRYPQKMPQHNALNAEMAEKCDSVRKIHERFLHKF